MNRPRKPGALQGLVLITAQLFSMLGAVLIAPMLSTMMKEFQATPGAEVLVPMLLTAPSLLLAFFSPVAGILGGRIGHRNLFLSALLIYGLTGMAPLFLTSLYGILASRLLLGAAEAALVTTAMVLLGAYFAGDERQKWVSYHMVVTPWAGAIIVAASGALGSLNWRYIFAMYGISLIVFLVALFAIREPKSDAAAMPEAEGAPVNLPAGDVPVPFAWRSLVHLGFIAVPGSVAFYIAPTQLSFLLDAVGASSPQVSATATAIALAVAPVGAFLTRRLRFLTAGRVLGLGFVAMAIGLLAMALGKSSAFITAGFVLQQIGGGIMIVTAISYVLAISSAEDRGKFSGYWWFIYTLAQFFAPPILVGLQRLLGGTTPAVVASALLLLVYSSWVFSSRLLARNIVIRQ